jgi:hypothetical protein
MTRGVVIDLLQAMHPTATVSECARFAAAHPPLPHRATGSGEPGGENAAAANKLRQYLEWKDHAETMLQRHGDGGSDGCSLWEQCMKAAFADFDGNDSTPAITSLPSCAFDPILLTPSCSRRSSRARCVPGADDAAAGCGVDADDTNRPGCAGDDDELCEPQQQTSGPILYVLPARMDLDTLPSDLYTKAMAYYCLKIYNGIDPITVLIDARAGRGWKNMIVTKMIPWLRPCCQTLYSYFPGGLHQVILYPVPAWTIYLYRLVRPFLHTDVQASMILLSGQSTAHQAPYPTELHSYVSSDVMKVLEKARQASFV